jgi:hypothetical protein
LADKARCYNPRRWAAKGRSLQAKNGEILEQ